MTDNEARRQELLRSRSEIEDRIGRIQREERREIEAGQGDNAHEWENVEVREGEISEASIELRGINAALERLDEGTYGRCALCGKKIPKKRLDALPYAVTCIACATAQQ